MPEIEVLLPIRVPDGDYCANNHDGSICGFFDNAGGHSTCDLAMGKITSDEQGRCIKPSQCKSLSVNTADAGKLVEPAVYKLWVTNRKLFYFKVELTSEEMSLDVRAHLLLADLTIWSNEESMLHYVSLETDTPFNELEGGAWTLRKVGGKWHSFDTRGLGVELTDPLDIYLQQFEI